MTLIDTNILSSMDSSSSVSSSSQFSDDDNPNTNGDTDNSVGTSSDDNRSWEEDKRDEIYEVQKLSRKDTFWIKNLRLVVLVLLAITATAVTVSTYKFLLEEQKHNFQTAFEQFSRTLQDAAKQQQIDIRMASATLTDSMTNYATTHGLQWPYVNIENYENMARHALDQANAEIVATATLVSQGQRTNYTMWANDHYVENVQDAHILAYGNLNRLQTIGYHPYLTTFGMDGIAVEDDIDRDYYWPMWHYSPPPFTYGLVNWNTGSVPHYESIINELLELKNESLATQVLHYVGVGTALSEEDHDAMHSALADGSTSNHPHSFVFAGVHETLGDDDSPIVALIGMGVAWDASMRNLLPEGVAGIIAVIQNTCNQSYTYEIHGTHAYFMGEEDLHDAQFDYYVQVADLAPHTHPDFKSYTNHCRYSLHVYPSTTFRSSYYTNTPQIFAAVVASTFALVIVIFFVYDNFVTQRNEKLVANAARSNAIVSSMFPSQIRDRLIGGQAQRKNDSHTETIGLLDGGRWDEGLVSKPLADLFLETTVIFSDITGFTAWSSVREPSQVFLLLEKVYGEFDILAKHRRIFKVETVGDCYVAAAGIPTPRKDHATAVARFARNIMKRMSSLTKELEVTLGPGTGDLSLRIGIHSGPVTGGMLRGDRSRFQLFGDTMNTAARIESASRPGRIQLSADTAELLVKAGKSSWIQKREEGIWAKGKGSMETYWLTMGGSGATEHSGSEASTHHVEYNDTIYDGFNEPMSRLIDWNVETLLKLIRQIIARRGTEDRPGMERAPSGLKDENLEEYDSFLDEVKEIIPLPEFNSTEARRAKDPEMVEIPIEVSDQLLDYVKTIAGMYRDNSFHSFQHASHVLMSVVKLMSRIVAPVDLELELQEHTNVEHNGNSSFCRESSSSKKKGAANLHDHTYGINSDPLTQFACAFSALIHDVDHTGVPNAQLVKEETPLAEKYKNRSVAEQNSLDLAWKLLMDDRFANLRGALYTNESGFRRFRSLVVNVVMATDIVDKDLKALRNARWDKAFDETHKEASMKDAVDRKATIVIEHLIQASDVSHTMQHWHVYRKWNERFFMENYVAYKEGRADKDPSETWYKGEMGFFDFYIIPLAKKLKECGVFGKSSDEFLNYAINNRREWEQRGQEVVHEMLENSKRAYEQ